MVSGTAMVIIPVVNTDVVALVDASDAQLVIRYKWYMDTKGYARGWAKDLPRVLMHRPILGMPPGKGQVDHINGVRLDNRRCNLRVASASENQWNRAIAKHNTSGHLGVGWDKRNLKWRTYVCVHGKRIELGRFENLDDAVRARKQGEALHYGDFAPSRCRAPT